MIIIDYYYRESVSTPQENFIENNTKGNSELVNEFVAKIQESMCGTESMKFASNTKGKQKTFSATFRTDLEFLISKLKQTVSNGYACLVFERVLIELCFFGS